MIDKVKVARSFSRSATTYDAVAYFQRQVGEHLLRLLPKARVGGCCLDLGCGTGYFRKLLMTQTNADYLGMDIAEGMLRVCREHGSGLSLLCADAETLPLRARSVSLIYSNLALQWCDNLPQLFGELYRVLPAGGTVALSTLGPKTLMELKQSWLQVDNLVHVNAFMGAENWRQAIEASGLRVERHQRQLETLKYPKVPDLLRELKLLGAHNVNHGQRQSLTGRRRLQGLLAAYQDFKIKDYYPATYEVLYWVLKK